MAKAPKKNEIDQIYQRLDQLASFIEKNFDELEDVSEIRSIVEDWRANLLRTIDERVEYIVSKQKDICGLRFSQIEDTINSIPEDIGAVKTQLLIDLAAIKKDLLANIGRTDLKIENHLKDKINWKQLFAPAIVSGFVTIVLITIVALADSYFQWGLLELLDKLK